MGILLILLPLLIYLVAALTVKKSEIRHPDDYFAAFRKVGRTEFTNSSIAYGFQVSTIYPFLFWGASMFLFVPFINAVFWGLGIFIFYLSMGKISKYIGYGKTLHGLIGDTYGIRARTLASLLTVIGFIGYIVAELWFGSRVLLAVLPNNNWIYLSAFGFIFFVTIYLFRAGQISSIRTDQLQLILTYFGIFGIILYLLYLVLNSATTISGELAWGLVFLASLSLVILALRRARFVALNVFFSKVLNTALAVFFVSVFVLSLLILFNNDSDFSLTGVVNLEGFGITGLLSLMVLPLCWQFVDLTNWQRLLSVQKSDVDANEDQNIRRGLQIFSVESPFTWILFIIFGLLISVSFPAWKFEDILVDFPRELIKSNSIFEQSLGYMFIASVISIMLSTVDSFIMGISFTFSYDMNPKTRKLLDGNERLSPAETQLVLNRGKYFGFLSVLVALGLFVFFDMKILGGGEVFIYLLLTFYSAAIALFPLVFGMLFLKYRPSETWVLSSMLVAAVAGISIGIYATLSNPSLAWYPVITSIVLGSTIFFIGLIFTHHQEK